MRAIICAIAALCLIASHAVADSPGGLVFLYDNERDGGSLLAYPVLDGSWGRMTWQACPPSGDCYEVSPDPAHDRLLHVGSAPAGTIFRATTSDGQQSLTAISDPYQGPLRAVDRPRVSGQVRVGHVVRAIAGQWSGGWGGEQPFLQLQVCRTRRSTTCEVIASTHYWERCDGVGARLPRRYQGSYLRVADSRLGRQLVFPAFVPRRPQDLAPLVAAWNTSVRTIGRIGPGRAVRRAC